MAERLRPLRPQLSLFAALGLGGLLAACSANRPQPDWPALTAAAPLWQAPLPPLPAEPDDKLPGWWESWQDPVLLRLQQQALQANSSLAQAVARIAQARAEAAAAGASLWPALDLKASVSAGKNPLQIPAGKQSTALGELDARWESDLSGAHSAARSSASARLEAREAEWQDARLSLAAEVANTYLALRTCEAHSGLQQRIVHSHQLSLEMAQQMLAAGFIAPLDLAQQRARQAAAASQLQLQNSACSVTLKALVVLCDLPEDDLRQLLQPRHALVPQTGGFRPDAIPAHTLLQRPDMRAAMHTLMGSAAEVGVADAQRYPSLSLLGAIGSLAARSAGQNVAGSSWSFGPVLDLPLFDGGRRRAGLDAAQARYSEALAQFRGKTLTSVREVEEALLRLDDATKNLQHQHTIAAGAALALQAAQAGVRHGSTSVAEREETLRQQLASQQQSLQAQRELGSAWIMLYKVAGGDWNSAHGAVAPTAGNTVESAP